MANVVSTEKDRQQMALKMLREGRVLLMKNDYFKVTGNSGKEWKVAVWDDDNIKCNCPVNKIRRQECHHIKAVQMYLVAQRTGWKMW